jgi:hypothetical protein
MAERDTAHDYLKKEDPVALASQASLEELQRLKAAEEVLELRDKRKRRSSRVSVLSAALVGYIALAGFFANAYQTFVNKREQERQSKVDADRWQQEFQRTRRADEYRAFFETSLLATDNSNPDKRIVGYALMQEFVNNESYNFKATLTLEESLARELRGNTQKGLEGTAKAAVVAIITALSQTSQCAALERAARSIDKLAERHAEWNDLSETGEVFRVYVRRLIGRAAINCTALGDFRAVRRPIRDTLLKNPELGGFKPGQHIALADANQRLAELLRDRCTEELSTSGATDCTDVYQRYAKLCAQSRSGETDAKAVVTAVKRDAGSAPARGDGAKDEEGACTVIQEAANNAAQLQSAAQAR